MEITTHKDGQTAEVVIKGDLNIYHAVEAKAGLMKAIDEAGEAVEAGNIGLDLSGVSEFDSSGLQLLILAFRETERKGRRLKIREKSGSVENVIGLFRLSAFFDGRHQEA